MNAALSWRMYFTDGDLGPLDLELRHKFSNYKLEDATVIDTVANRLPPGQDGRTARSLSSVALLGHWGTGPDLGRPLQSHEQVFGWLHALAPGLVLHLFPGNSSRYCGFLERVPKGESAFGRPTISLVPIVGRGELFSASMNLDGVAETRAACPQDRNAKLYEAAGVAGYMYRDLDRDTYEYGAFSKDRWAELSRWLDHWLPRGE
jgi:hypothetical protein